MKKILLGLVIFLTLFAFVSQAHASTHKKAAKRTCAKNVADYAYASPDPAMESVTATSLACRSTAPWVLIIHGGSWINGDRYGASVTDAVDSFYAHGWQTFNMEYRRGADVSWHMQSNDLIAARNWIVAHASTFGLDPSRGSVWGFSAGGHMAAWLGLQAQYGFRAVTTASGVLQPTRVCNAANGLETDGEPSTPTNQNLCDREQTMMGCDSPGTLDQDNDCDSAWYGFSPQTKITSDSPPMLMFQGSDDPAVPPKTADSFAYWLGQAGVSHTVNDVAGYGHDSGEIFDSSANVSQMLNFVAKESQ